MEIISAPAQDFIVFILIILSLVAGFYYLKIPLEWISKSIDKSIQQNTHVDFAVVVSTDDPLKISIPSMVKLYDSSWLGINPTHIGVKVSYIMQSGEVYEAFFKLMPLFNLPRKTEYVLPVKKENRDQLKDNIQQRYSELKTMNVNKILVTPYINILNRGKAVIEPK